MPPINPTTQRNAIAADRNSKEVFRRHFHQRYEFFCNDISSLSIVIHIYIYYNSLRCRPFWFGLCGVSFETDRKQLCGYMLALKSWSNRHSVSKRFSFNYIATTADFRPAPTKYLYTISARVPSLYVCVYVVECLCWVGKPARAFSFIYSKRIFMRRGRSSAVFNELFRHIIAYVDLW